MTIESGTTGERRIRISIFLVMCLVMGGWFAYDGFRGYAAKNLKWAIEAMPEQPPEPRTNPRASVATLGRIAWGMTVQELTDLVGQPLLVEPRQLIFHGPKLTAIVRMDDGKVLGVETKPTDPKTKPADISEYVTADTVEKIAAGMTETELKALLYQDAPKEQHKTLWFVGPAAYTKVAVRQDRVVTDLLFGMPPALSSDLDARTLSRKLRDQFVSNRTALSDEASISVVREGAEWTVSDDKHRYLVLREGSLLNTYVAAPEVYENEHHSESDIRLQRIIATILAVLAAGVIVKLFFVLRTRVVLDDTGLTLNRKHVSWDAMTTLATDEYEKKGWVDLGYRTNGTMSRVRLDCYHIERFDEVVNAICERKGFASPIGPRDLAPDEEVY